MLCWSGGASWKGCWIAELTNSIKSNDPLESSLNHMLPISSRGPFLLKYHSLDWDRYLSIQTNQFISSTIRMHDFSPSRIGVAAVICLCSSPTRSRIQKLEARTYLLSESSAWSYYMPFELSVPLSDTKPRWNYRGVWGGSWEANFTVDWRRKHAKPITFLGFSRNLNRVIM